MDEGGTKGGQQTLITHDPNGLSGYVFLSDLHTHFGLTGQSEGLFKVRTADGRTYTPTSLTTETYEEGRPTIWLKVEED